MLSIERYALVVAWKIALVIKTRKGERTSLIPQ